MLTTTSNKNLLSLQTLTNFIQDKKFKSTIELAIKDYLNDAKVLQSLYEGYEDDLFLSSLGYILVGFNFVTKKVVVQIAEVSTDNLTGFNPVEKYKTQFNPYEDALFFLDIKSNNPVRRYLQKSEITEEKCIQLLTNRIKKLLQKQVNELNLHSPYWGLAANSYYLMCTKTSALIRQPQKQLALPINLFSVNDLEQYFLYLSKHRGFQTDVIEVTLDFENYPEKQELFNKLNKIEGVELKSLIKKMSYWEPYLENPDEIEELYNERIETMVKTLLAHNWSLQQIFELSKKSENPQRVRDELLNAIESYSVKYKMLNAKEVLSNWTKHQNFKWSENNYLVDMTKIKNILKQAHISQYLYDDAMNYFEHNHFVFKDKSQIENVENKFEYESYNHTFIVVMTDEEKQKFLKDF